MKNDNFFKHDASACNGEKMMNLIDKEGLRGYGAYWVLLEALRKGADLCCPLSILQSLAVRSRVRASYLLHIVQDFGLFVVEKDHFYSPGMKRRMSTYLLSSKLESVKKRPKVLEMSESSAVPARITEKNRREQKRYISTLSIYMGFFAARHSLSRASRFGGFQRSCFFRPPRLREFTSLFFYIKKL